MPLKVRRTPETEKAASYGYGDLLVDSIKALIGDKPEQKKRLLEGKPTSEDLMEMAFAPQAGMLKAMGTGKLLSGLLRGYRTGLMKGRLPEVIAKAFVPAKTGLKEALKVPESEFRRISDINWRSTISPSRGQFVHGIRLEKGTIDLHPTDVRPGTVWHEFTHARQFSPGKGEMEGIAVTEKQAANALVKFWEELLPLAQEHGYSMEDFYTVSSPIERHAREVSEKMLQKQNVVKGAKDFGRIFRKVLEKELGFAERGMEIFGKPERAKGIWEEVLLRKVKEVK
jgi:hypothetical protein